MPTYLECYERVLSQRAKIIGKQGYFFCPFPGCSGYDKRKLNVDLETGAWYCFHCSQESPGREYRNADAAPGGGTALEFAVMMGDDTNLWPTGKVTYIPTTKASPLSGKRRREVFTFLFNQCRLTEEHRTELLARGIDPDAAGIVSAGTDVIARLQQKFDPKTILRAGLAYEDKNDGHLLARYCIQPGRILIPYFDKAQVYYFVGYAKYPRRQPDQTVEAYQILRETWPKVASPAGYTPATYGQVPERAEYVIITEGQFKALAAIQHGFACIGVQGITTGHASVVKKCGESGVKRAVIMFDTQADDQETIDWASEKLARELLKAGIPTYKAALPLDSEVDKGRKMDIDSFLLHHPLEELVSVLCHARRYKLQAQESDEEEEE